MAARNEIPSRRVRVNNISVPPSDCLKSGGAAAAPRWRGKVPVTARLARRPALVAALLAPAAAAIATIAAAAPQGGGKVQAENQRAGTTAWRSSQLDRSMRELERGPVVRQQRREAPGE
jgi:hypothetical protein